MTGFTPGKAMVVGGRGFLGRHIVTALTAAGFEVIETVRDGSGDAGGAVALDLLTSPASTLRAVLDQERPTVVVNAAGAVVGTAAQLAGGNVVGPVRLLTAMTVTAPKARYVHLGSAAEYGSAALDRPVDEDDDPRPLGAYGVSKLAGTRAVLALAADAGLTASVLRIFNPVGAGSPSSTLPGRLAHLLRTVADGQPLSVGPLDAFRDFVDVTDVIKQKLQAIEAYNGLGYQRFHPTVPTPYLWAATTLYTRGKYVSDGRYDPMAVDKQLGVAAILKRAVERGVQLPF